MQYKSFWLITLNEEGNKKTCDYWYLIQTYGGTAHTAFNKRSSLIKWLGERGLELTEEMPEHGTFSWQRVTGEYRQRYVLSADEFSTLRGQTVRALHNGQYTQAIITDDADGFKTVHTAHFEGKPIFDYWESKNLQG